MPTRRSFDPRSVFLPVIGLLLGCSETAPAPETTGPELGVPPPPPATSVTPLVPPSGLDPEKVMLGKSLFNDPRLSRDRSISCASCHDVGRGGDDGRRYPVGVDGRRGSVNAPTVLNSALNVAQFWDGRALTLEAQVDETVRSPTEMDGEWAAIEARLEADEPLAGRFRRLYGEGPRSEHVVDAIAEYLRALITVGSPFDRYLAGDEDALGADAVEGYEVFVELGCVSCHQGRNVGGNFFQRIGVMDDYFEGRAEVTSADLGRYNVTGREEDRHKFKVPSLRNVAETAPYFHDGSAATLEEAVRTMARYQLGRPASDRQIELVVAFLESLSGEVEGSLR